MADWKENKGLGPWDFIEQPDKWGYLNNPRWASLPEAQEFCESKGVISGSSNQHKPCGHWHKGYVPKYDECSLEPLFDWSESASGESFINYNDGKIFILQRIYNDGRVYVYNLDGSPITDFPTTIINTSPSCMKCLSVDNNHCYVGATSNVIGPVKYAHIARFSHGGTYQMNWKVGSGTYGSGVQGVSSDGDHVYVTSRYGLHKYTTGGALIWEHPYRGIGIGKFWTAYDMWSDGTHIFVVGYSNHKILKYLCSDGSFMFEEENMVPASPSAITVDDKYAYVVGGWEVCIFYKDTLGHICCVVFDNHSHDLGNVLGGMTYDGEYWWGLDGNLDKVVKFDIHVMGEPIKGIPGIPEMSDEPQVWPMPE